MGGLRTLCFALIDLMGLAAGASGQTRSGFGRERPGDFDFYVLALSWSPGFCALDRRRAEREQCEPGRNPGFVVHGLWPQHERGYPTECGPARQPTRLTVDEARGLFPDEGLARHQWRRHGTCSGLSPAGYFQAVREARERIRIPERFHGMPDGQAMAPIEIERAFVEANPGLRVDMMSVVCRRRTLQEVRICLDRDLRHFRRCPEVDRDGCRGGDVQVGASR